MGTGFHSFCERMPLTLTVVLLAACATNLALVYAWL